VAYGSLTSSQLGVLMRFGGPHEAALKAIEDPDFKRVFEDLGGVRVEEQNGRLYVVPLVRTSESENRVWDAVYAWAEGQSLEDDEANGELARQTPGAKSRWRRADLETIFAKQPGTSARKLAASGDLVEPIRHQRISELRARGDIGVDKKGRLVLPTGTTGEGGWIILPKLG
jgi:hypothetical protein